VLDESDSASTKAEFYVTDNNSYTRFGEMEQLVSDSIALLISDKLQRIFVYKDARGITDQMKKMMSLSLPDSSVLHIAGKFSINKSIAGDSTSLRLQSRSTIYSTSLPKEIISITYNGDTKQPYRVEQVRRELIRLDDNSADSTNIPRNITIVRNDNGVFAVQERKMVFSYALIEYGKTLKTPVIIADRIVKNESGEFVPAKGYENYTVTQD